MQRVSRSRRSRPSENSARWRSNTHRATQTSSSIQTFASACTGFDRSRSRSFSRNLLLLLLLCTARLVNTLFLYYIFDELVFHFFNFILFFSRICVDHYSLFAVITFSSFFLLSANLFQIRSRIIHSGYPSAISVIIILFYAVSFLYLSKLLPLIMPSFRI